MATDAYKVLHQSQLPSSAASLYSPASGKAAIIRSISVRNNDSSTRTFSLYINGTAASNRVTGDISLKTGEWWEWSGNPIALDDADSIQGVASAASQLTITMTGDEVTY